MLVQWLISILLSAVITLGATQGFLLQSRMHYAQVILSEEQSQIRFLVGYFRTILHAAVVPHQFCGDEMNEVSAVVPLEAHKELLLHVRICKQEYHHSVIMPMRFFIAESEMQQGLTLFVQEGEHRREALVSGFQALSLQYCNRRSKKECQPASAIQDWTQIDGVEVNLQFQPKGALDALVFLKNHHRWKYRIKISGFHEAA
jgi:hypothetical protein